MRTGPGEITQILARAADGDRTAEEQLMRLVYKELRKLARRLLQSERPDHSLQATALVHEAYLRLMQPNLPACENRVHFFAVAARKMRQILVDHARALGAVKRRALKVSLDSALVYSEDRSPELLAVDEALSRLEIWDPRQCRVVELRYFAGLTEAEIGAALGISERTVKREWKMARAWLYGELASAKPQRAADTN